MVKLNKSELKKHLISSVQLLKKNLTYTAYCYLILAVLLFFHVGEVSSKYDPTESEATAPIPELSFRGRKRDLRQGLIKSFSNLESKHPGLTGVLMPSILETPISDDELLAYRNLLDQLQQTTGIFSTAESFSHAYEYWISQLAGMTIKSGVSFYTPRSLTHLLVSIMKPAAGMSIYDPTAGTGGMLIACAEYIRQQGEGLDTTHFSGREKSPDIWAICKMNAFVHQMENVSIEQVDSLQNGQNQFGKFDLVLQHLPLSPDPRNKGLTRRMDAAFLWQAVDVLSPYGRAAVLSTAALLREDHADIWRHILNRDWLEAVITLPSNLLHGTNAAASILVLNKRKPVEHLSQVLFIQFPPSYTTRSRHYELRSEDIQSLVETFEHWGRGSDYARVVSVSRIEEQNYSLSIERYPDLGEAAESFDLAAALNRYHTAIQKRETAVAQLLRSLEGLQKLPKDKNFLT
ncbi:MAG: SAM-dependent methyltransferase [Anaerolineae bacterium]|nr:SAM-dependent methyltransferase [Anaerolineae bacterium]